MEQIRLEPEFQKVENYCNFKKKSNNILLKPMHVNNSVTTSKIQPNVNNMYNV